MTRLRPYIEGAAPLWLFVGLTALGGLLGALFGWDMNP